MWSRLLCFSHEEAVEKVRYLKSLWIERPRLLSDIYPRSGNVSTSVPSLLLFKQNRSLRLSHPNEVAPCFRKLLARFITERGKSESPCEPLLRHERWQKILSGDTWLPNCTQPTFESSDPRVACSCWIRSCASTNIAPPSSAGIRLVRATFSLES